MTQITVYYEDSLRTKSVLHPQGKQMWTDGPKNLGGLDEYYSPTDLIGSALGACMLTMMGLEAKKRKLSIAGACVDVEKQLASTPPYAIASLHVKIKCPDPKEELLRQAFIKAAHSCPIHHSLHPNIQKTIDFEWI